MTQQDDWRPEMARLTQRQDQLERQQKDANKGVEALRRDANALKRDVDRRVDSLRGETDRQSRDRDWRVSSLERSRDTAQNLFWFSIPLVAAVAMIIILVIAVVASREQRREAGEPEKRSPSSIDAPLAGSGGPLPPGLVAPGRLSDNLTAGTASTPPGRPCRRSRELLSFNGLAPWFATQLTRASIVVPSAPAMRAKAEVDPGFSPRSISEMYPAAIPVFPDSSLRVMPWWFRNARMGPFPRIMSRATSWGTRTPSSASWPASMSSSWLFRSMRASYSLRVKVMVSSLA